MERAVSLGRVGEAAWDSLRRHHRLERRRGVVLVLSDHKGARDEVRRRLGQLAPLAVIVPHGRAVVDVYEAAQLGPGGGGGLPSAWMEADEEVELAKVWVPALASLNLAREALDAHGAVFIVLVGPMALADLASKVAPDLYSVARVLDLPEAPRRLVGGAGTLSWLHLSDLHVRSSFWEEDGVLLRLRRDLPEILQKEGIRPDLVFVTGDLSLSGRKSELDAAYAFLVGLMADLGLAPAERLFVVPGNHDVSRGDIGRLVRRDQAAVLEKRGQEFRDDVSAVWKDIETLRQYGDRLANWSIFTSQLVGPARAVQPDRPWRTDVRSIAGIEVGIASLCSAWMSGPDDDRPGRVVLGVDQVRAALNELSGCALRIVLLHHPIEWLHDGEQQTIHDFISENAHIVLHGHLHESDKPGFVRSAWRGLVAAVGAAGAESRWPRGFELGTVYPGDGYADLRFYAYSDRDGGGWTPGSVAMQGMIGSVTRLSLSLEGLATTQSPARASVSGLAARLARAADSVYSSGGFIGIPARAGIRRPAGLMDVFQPLDFAKWGEAEGTVGLNEVESALFGGPGRVVVLGDPGSGKTTLTRYLALRAARREPPVAPLLLPLREWLREGSDQGLLAWGATFLSRQLSVPLDEAALVGLCDAGPALLILDGLDEVAQIDQRSKVRDQVVAIARRYSHIAMLATSRILGYEQAALPEPVQGFGRPLPAEEQARFSPPHTLFWHLALTPFTDVQLDNFVARWHEAMFVDPVARARGRADLQAAFAAEPRARELARNPLLATLIAMVHQHEVRLPGQRARLYELVVTMLLETWPESRGQRFLELEEGRQRMVLGQLALRMQERRSQPRTSRGGINLPPWLQESLQGEPEISVDRSTLECEIADLLVHNGFTDAPGAPRLARRWLDWLAQGTGLLVEQQPAVFAFLHLSVFEYLAARALWDRLSTGGDPSVAEFVFEHHRIPAWQETLLLMLGSESHRSSLMAMVLDKLEEVWTDSDPDTAGAALAFALGMVREEVEVPERTCIQILDATSQRSPNLRFQSRERVRGLLKDVLRLGQRSGEAARRWLASRLSTARGAELLAVAALVPDATDALVAPLKERRSDRAEAAADLLDLLLHPWGLWASTEATAPGWLRWSETIAPDLAFARAAWPLSLPSDYPSPVPERAPSALLVAILRRAATTATLLTQGAEGREPRRRLPAALHCAYAATRLCTQLTPSATPRGGFIAPAQAESRDLIRETTGWISAYLGGPLKGELRSNQAIFLGADTGRLFAKGLLQFMRFHLLGEPYRIPLFLADHLLVPGLKELSPPAAPPSQVMEAVYFKRINDPPISLRPTPVRPPAALCTPDLDPLEAFRAETPEGAQHPILLAFAAEIHAGLVPLLIDAPGSRDQATLLATLRVQNRWLYTFYDPIARYALSLHPDALPPEIHALLLALGLAQHQTTGQWPWGRIWAGWFSTGTPPEHWLPSFVWHQIQAIAAEDPAQSDAWLQKAEADLDRGDWPELAARLRALILIPTPPEIRALFDAGPFTDAPTSS